MRRWPQLLADISGRCAAIFMKAQLYFLGLEKARLEKLYGVSAAARADRKVDETGTPRNVLQLLAPESKRRRSRNRRRRSRNYVA